jgi:hypothetical protein
MPACHIQPQDKKKLISAVGRDLVRRHGKQKYYRPTDVRSAAERCGYPLDLCCWAYCFYCSPADFEAVHQAAGEVCNYTAMKAEVLGDLAGGSFSWFDIDLSWLEWPDIDLSSAFDWFDFS